MEPDPLVVAAFDQGDLARAQKRQAAANVVIQIFIRYGGLAAGKAIMKILGLDCGPTRLPLRPLSDPQQAQLRAELESASYGSLIARLNVERATGALRPELR